MSNFNPYQTPSSDVTPCNAPSAMELAGRGQRLGASMIDSLIMMLFVLPLMYLMGMFEYAPKGVRPPFSLMLIATVIGFMIFVAIHYLPLKRNGQTIGKKLLNIRIADLDGNKPELTRILLMRYMPVQFITLIPVIGQIAPLVDILLIFRDDKRCAHDLIAGTQVLRVTKEA